MQQLIKKLKYHGRRCWDLIREVSGDADYDRYLAHFAIHHAQDGKPLSRAEFYKRSQERKWGGINRCC